MEDITVGVVAILLFLFIAYDVYSCHRPRGEED